MNKLSYIFLFLCLLSVSYCNEVTHMLDERMKKTDSLVCVGLDPDLTKMPLSIMQLDIETEEKVFIFLSQIIDITAPHACAYKPQKAFFDQFTRGCSLLQRICSYIHEQHPGIPVFVDCKVGDTDNTMKTYMHILFDEIKADGVVINPYMGDDVMEPFIQDAKKVAIVLAQTSNPNGKVVQELTLEKGTKLWEEILHLILTRWNKNENLIPVLSSNASSTNYETIRKKIPQTTPILLAGVGSQGGDPKVMKQLLNDEGRGVFVNSSRGILYPYSPENENWKEEVLKAVITLKDDLNTIRKTDGESCIK